MAFILSCPTLKILRVESKNDDDLESLLPLAKSRKAMTGSSLVTRGEAMEPWRKIVVFFEKFDDDALKEIRAVVGEVADLDIDPAYW